MNKFLLAGAAVVFAGVAATVSFAADHKAKPAAPARASMMATTAAPSKSHKAPAPKRHHHVVKRHHVVHRAHAK